MDKYLLKKNKQPNFNVELATSFSLDAFNSNMSTTSATNTTSKLTSNSKKSTLANARSVSSILDVSEEKNKLLALQGLSLRGIGSNERSNFNEILQARSEDILELRAWLHRKGHKWTSHDIQNEILELMASNIKQQNLKEIKAAHFFSLTLDETSDIARLEQVSISIRIHVFAECGLDMKKLRGQCYDGASNVSGKISGLQTRIRKEEPRAVFVHCNAHRLNLVVQDAIEDITTARNFVGVIKDLITFIQDSPKRLAEYKRFQGAVLKEDDEENLGKTLTIAPYCPIRWCMRVFSLKTLQQKINYMAALQFLGVMKMNREVDSSISSKAVGFLKHLESFEFYFQLTMIVEVFEKIELLNKKLQESNLCALEKWMLS
ncbi:zinc finger MYM-type protein 1-like [Solenopsis invicta]|uniref:zinc finger MYM-type protein 1-like n=1 Tax=Solenopsis invicta TaxID=13686 RepID=UPI000595933A|nr:zinc finger MYM-type protein 1-like [Solenopsis invicta]